ncbi:MAG: SIS domain-containing protein [Anaerolineales bacterium]|nr:SIS domain-containing protein [Anaerolineales bacterium]
MNWIEHLKGTYPELTACLPSIQQAFEAMRISFSQGGKLLVCGNGGSAADSEHIVGEMMKGYLCKRALPKEVQQKLRSVHEQDGQKLAMLLQGGLPAISLVSQSALISAIANDTSAEMVFAQQVIGYGRAGDVLWGLSTSGNARNVIAAFQTARAVGVRTIALTGPTGGELMAYSDIIIRVPGENTPAIQERHLPIYHTLCAMLEAEFFTI